MKARVTHPAGRSGVYQGRNKRDTVSSVPLISNSWWWGQSHIKQAVGKNVPENSAEHKQGVDTEKYPKQGLLLEPLLIVLQNNHTKRQADHHSSQVSYKAGIRAWRKGRRVEPEPYCSTKLYTHCGQKGERKT